MAHSLKSIKYLNQEKHILLQNENGPCPLLAAANALILQSQIEFPPAVIRSNVASIDQVINLLAEHCFSKTENEGSQHHMDELMQLFPSLQFGMDVNPKFTGGVNAVEYNSGLSAFDLMGVELVHGWLVDVQDTLNANAIQGKSYNELVEMIIQGKDANVKIADLEAKVKELEAVLTVLDEIAQTTESLEKDGLNEAMANVNIGEEESSNKDEAENTPSSSSDVGEELSKLQQELDTQTKLFQNGHIVEEFLLHTSTQLTHTGLIELHNHIQPNKFYVFFRNNHFCTITKHDDSLFLLVTDLGYANVSEVVWEKLDDISGDTEYFNAEFVKSPPLSQMTATGPSLSPEQLLAQSSAAERDYQLALQLSKNENDIDAQEGKLIAAATEASLQAYNAEHNSTLQQETSEDLMQHAREEEDRLVAMRLQNQYEQEATQERARREQQMEQERLHQQHIRQQQQRQQGSRGGARQAKKKDDGCIIS
ncbi:hypothetical protein CTEN210_13288 [Chaetoceros tenuissimus]|uniref:MINDY deubiquitinase domain-containing protein n=1 Tax=Chaetoceros tenuissimus TaxID=426638 RepID=A0AAD3D3E3_9STRA|nr:hypothetical protein CTEN210_13288 [Chaetoceros tenuissimus]